jgi:hypothetical protein
MKPRKVNNISLSLRTKIAKITMNLKALMTAVITRPRTKMR